MKKMLMIAISLCILSAGNALASNSKGDPLDRNAVWTNGSTEKNNHPPSSGNRMVSKATTGSKSSSVQSTKGMHEKKRDFDFIRETKFYDYQKEKNNSG